MSMQDPIANMLTSIRNAQAAGEVKVKNLPYSHFKISILNVLKREGYIEDYSVISTDQNKKDIGISLKYYQGQPVIEKLKRVSRPGLRVYKRSSELSLVKGGMGIAIISTPKGVMTDKDARSQKLGGEVVCIVE